MSNIRKLGIFLAGILLATGLGAFAAIGGKLGLQLTSIATLLECEDETLHSCFVSLAGSTANLTQATTSNQVKASAGEMIGFYVNSTNAGTLRFYDQVNATCNSGPKGGAITPAIGYHPYPAKFATGICALTGGTGIDVTAVYR